MKRFNVRTGAGLAACSAMALALLTGCAGQAGLASAGRPAAYGEQPAVMADRVIAKAEDRVARSPRNAAARVELAQAYLAVGRFSAAATTFEDAVSLGESSPRLGLNQALAYIGSGRNDEALKVLDRWRNQIAASDLGLALALAGQSDQGVAVLSDALRGGDNTAKIRQNLAYAYALDGRWTEARVIASQDVPADQLDARMSEWASRGQSEQYRTRIAGLLGVPVGPDAGQPAELALNGVEHAARMAVMDAPAPAPLPAAELPPVSVDQKTVEEIPPQADALPPSLAMSAQPVSQLPAPSLPTKAKVLSQPKTRSSHVAHHTPVASAAPRTHLVQLGSFRTMEGAKRAWGIFVARNPALKSHTLRITEAEVRGERYFRVAAEGFDGGSARTLCADLRQHGGACLAYADTRPLPGAIPDKIPSAPMLAHR
ncbi:tetratricopeptide repeat protein [Novosphingobium sp.]|uniref:tetratricopeptide repeat protein n=2 Tax=Novosphingobium sp. TaxID=1874826 RepID=UPI002FDAAC4C